MRINQISSHVIYPPDLQEKYRRGNENFQRLAGSLNSGDLAGAQKAFAAFRLDIQNIQQAQNTRHTCQPTYSGKQVDDAQPATSKGANIDVWT
jgi:hypothetical protein